MSKLTQIKSRHTMNASDPPDWYTSDVGYLLGLVERMRDLIVSLETRWISPEESRAWCERKTAILKELEE